MRRPVFPARRPAAAGRDDRRASGSGCYTQLEHRANLGLLPMSIRLLPGSSYRLQFGTQFGFADARQLVPYLEALGVTTCYASPLLQAARGSAHGYDIATTTRSTTISVRSRSSTHSPRHCESAGWG